METDKITVIGRISKIIGSKDNEKTLWFDICKNKKYYDKDGTLRKETSFFTAMLDKNKFNNYEELIKVGSLVMITGIPKSYFNKENIKCFYIRTLKIEPVIEKEDIKTLEKKEPSIYENEDGVMVWNGKKCESVTPTREEKEEMDKLISLYNE